MVGAIGFEPTTPCSRSRCATRLRYAPTCDEEDAGCWGWSAGPGRGASRTAKPAECSLAEIVPRLAGFSAAAGRFRVATRRLGRGFGGAAWGPGLQCPPRG